MRRILPTILVTAILAAALVATSGRSAGADAPASSIAEFLKIRTPIGPGLLPDGSMLVLDRPEGVQQLYRIVPKDRPAPGTIASYKPGETTVEKLTDYADGLTTYAITPDARRVILVHARGGDENTQLTLLDPETRKTTPIVSNPKVRANLQLGLRDNSAIVYSANDESPEDFHLYQYDFATGETRKLVAKEGAWSATDVTKDGARFLVTRLISASDAQCYELTRATGALKDITLRPKGGTANCRIVGYMPDERSVLMISDHQGGRRRLYVRDLGSGKVREPLPALTKYDLDNAAVDDDRTMLVVVANQDGYAVPTLVSLPKFERRALPEMEKGVVGLTSFLHRTLIWSQSNARTPGLSYATYFPAKGAAVTRQLTWADDRGIDLAGFRLPELVHYRSFDGREIPAFLYLPRGYTSGTTVPFIVLYHGGPEEQSRPGFNATYQYYLSRGYGMMMPNVRGSTGYGREYEMLDNYKNRWNSVRDGVDAVEWLVKSGYAVPGHIAAYGGSYGGFMSVACQVEDQERVDRGERRERLFGACVDVVGIVNFQTFLEKTSGYRRKLREAEYGPLTDPDFLATISSIHKVDKIQAPMFIAHGFNDPRVPVQEAMQVAAALKESGRNPRVFIAPDEGHGFAKLDNRVYFGERVAQFLDETIAAGMPHP